jgi:hypothetical protein
MSIPVDVVPDVLVLAGIDRAERHRPRDTPGVPVWELLEHLGMPRRSKGARHVRSRLDALEAAGALVCSRRHGVLVWALSGRGRRRLGRARAAGRVPVLPESPQHRAWREARVLAAQEIERFRSGLGDAILQTFFLLEEDPSPDSDGWLEMAERLRRACWLLGSATHCLYEWVEPDDERADIDDHQDRSDEGLSLVERERRRARRAGRRNTRLWNRPAQAPRG